jgi:hypothetical protein
MNWVKQVWEKMQWTCFKRMLLWTLHPFINIFVHMLNMYVCKSIYKLQHENCILISKESPILSYSYVYLIVCLVHFFPINDFLFYEFLSLLFSFYVCYTNLVIYTRAFLLFLFKIVFMHFQYVCVFVRLRWFLFFTFRSTS